ncbi:MAG: hypothetical protein AMXMBFR34_46180 [Myxococcaceae bacterium]
MLAALLTLCVGAAPQRWLLTVDGVPLAELRVSVDGRAYRYESTRFLEEGPAERLLDFTLDEAGRVDGLTPEVLALASRPGLGCQQVFEELRRAPEELCVNRREGATDTGQLAGQPYSARYDARGKLATLTLGKARFEARAAPTTLPPPEANPFTRGFPLEGTAGPAALEPPLGGARRLDKPPRGAGDAESVGRVRCLIAARRYVASHPKAEVVLGLVLEDGRAWPHAWVRELGVEVDPSVAPGDAVLKARQYLALPPGEAGRVYLELLDGTRRVRLGASR